jgi:hypothetical protein
MLFDVAKNIIFFFMLSSNDYHGIYVLSAEKYTFSVFSGCLLWIGIGYLYAIIAWTQRPRVL